MINFEPMRAAITPRRGRLDSGVARSKAVRANRFWSPRLCVLTGYVLLLIAFSIGDSLTRRVCGVRSCGGFPAVFALVRGAVFTAACRALGA